MLLAVQFGKMLGHEAGSRETFVEEAFFVRGGGNSTVSEVKLRKGAQLSQSRLILAGW